MTSYLRESDEDPSRDEAEMTAVFLVYWMSYDLNGVVIEGMDRDDCCLIGVYSDRTKAEAAIERSKLLPGFQDYPEYFLIDRYPIDEDHWTSGFYFGP